MNEVNDEEFIKIRKEIQSKAHIHLHHDYTVLTILVFKKNLMEKNAINSTQ